MAQLSVFPGQAAQDAQRRRQARVVVVTFLREATVVAMLAGSVLGVCRA
jgi:hypothetical protein